MRGANELDQLIEFGKCRFTQHDLDGADFDATA